MASAAQPSIFRADAFAGKCGIVTGGGTGLGFAIARELLSLGAAVLMGLQGGNPLATLCHKHGLAMHRLQHACPLHDADGAL